MSQIVNYADVDLEKLSLFLRYLLPRLTVRVNSEVIDFSTVELTHIKQARSSELALDLSQGEAPLTPAGGVGTGTARDPHLRRLEEVLAKINDLFSGEDFTVAEQQCWV